nr:hypothetical protein [Tanacetum cinerariifolium]
MASSSSDRDVEYALSRLMQRDADEDISVDEVSSVIDGVFDSGECNVESMEVRSKFGKFLENKESVEEVFVSGGEALRVDEDELNRVISVLKNRGGEFDDTIDEINLGLREEYRKTKEGCCVMSKAVEGKRGKRVLVAAVEDEIALF